MSFSMPVTIGPNLSTGLGDGQLAAAYLASRFGSAPGTNTARPTGSDDGGGNQTVTNTQVTFTCQTYALYYVASWDPADTSNGGGPSIYWTAAMYPQVPTPAQSWSRSRDLATSSRQHGGCGTTSGSAVVTDSLITSDDAPTSGAQAQVTVSGTGIPANATIVSVVPGVSFTMNVNATATGSALLTLGPQRSLYPPTGNQYTNGSLRRIVMATAELSVRGSIDQARVDFATTIGGNAFERPFGILQDSRSPNSSPTSGSLTLDVLGTFFVDPGGTYSARTQTSGSNATVTLTGWVELDF